ncbi:CinY protein [Actinoplanes sp. CA-030573]|uniref:CinY protein n=1 Tax=Actinoplanes sp. CA-030573 TaxID=3239898 RepID=UPI003D8ABDE5
MLLVLTAWMALPAGPAAAFGTIDGGGQHREHERLTRAALSCAGTARSDQDCFAARSMDQLAGRGKGFGAVGAPDSDEISDPAAHCDNADFLPGSYPRTRDQATTQLIACIDHLRMRFRQGVDSAEDLLDDQGRVVADEVILDRDCRPGNDEDRAKCTVIEGLGRALHGAQDFYAHSNWADEADPARPTGPENPPGLNRPGPSALFDLRGDAAVSVPEGLATGCFVLKDESPGVGNCTGRITHAALNKDNGIIDPASGEVTGPTTARGMVARNFAKAVAGAIAETRRQWQDFRAALAERYGPDRAARMICALTRDDPVRQCNRPTGAAAAGHGAQSRAARLGVLAVAGVAFALLAGALTLRTRRRGWGRRHTARRE